MRCSQQQSFKLILELLWLTPHGLLSAQRWQRALGPLLKLDKLLGPLYAGVVATVLASVLPNVNRAPLSSGWSSFFKYFYANLSPTSFSGIQWHGRLLPSTTGWSHSVWSGTWGFSLMVSEVWGGGPDPHGNCSLQGHSWSPVLPWARQALLILWWLDLLEETHWSRGSHSLDSYREKICTYIERLFSCRGHEPYFMQSDRLRAP